MQKNLMTKLTHAGERAASSVSTPKVLPIYMSSVFSFDDVETLDRVYDSEAHGYVYSRMSNPGHDALQEIIAQAEEGEDARVYSSGMAAITMTVLAHVQAGDHIISSPVLYGGTFEFFKEELKRFNVDVTFVDFDRDNIENYFRPNTKVVYMETISNPLMEVTDIRKIARIAHQHNAKLIIDNTFATPVICQPLKLGADVVVHSATKYLGGHSDIIGGAVVSDSETIKRIEHAGTVYGPTMSPFDAWLLARSMRTLELRVVQHSNNAMKLAKYLTGHDKITQVFYPGLPSSPSHVVAKEIFYNDLFGGMLSMDVVNGEKGVATFIRSLKTIKFVPSLAGVTTSISYPAKTSHRAYSPEEREKVGISMGLLRVSTGLESIDDVIGEFDEALKRV